MYLFRLFLHVENLRFIEKPPPQATHSFVIRNS